MKWIKYQLLCNEKDNIFLTKKVGYSEENLAIAEEEAYNGEYEIIEDDENFEPEPLAVKFGGTGGRTLDEAKLNLGILGLVDKGLLTHEFASADESTVEYWRAMGTGIFHAPNVTPEGNYAVQGNYIGGSFFGLSNAGVLINIVRNISDYGRDFAVNDVTQYFISGGAIYTRNNSSNSGKWFRDWAIMSATKRIGKYTGAGTYGEDNPCKINVSMFHNSPKVLFINYDHSHTVMFHKSSFSTGEPVQYFYTDASGNEQEIILTWGDDYISWYSTVGEEAQLNHNWYTYCYLIF